MQILLDENLPTGLTAALRGLGHDVEHAYTKDLGGHIDPDVRAVAESEERFLITQDIRFADVRAFASGTHAGLLLVRLKHPGRRALFEKVYSVFVSENVESWRGCFVVLSDAKLRVRCPAR